MKQLTALQVTQNKVSFYKKYVVYQAHQRPDIICYCGVDRRKQVAEFYSVFFSVCDYLDETWKKDFLEYKRNHG